MIGHRTKICHPGYNGVYVDYDVPEIVMNQLEELLNDKNNYDSFNDYLYADIEEQLEIPTEKLKKKTKIYEYIVSSSFDLYISNLNNFFSFQENIEYVPEISKSWFVIQKKNEYNPPHTHGSILDYQRATDANGIIYFRDWDSEQELLMQKNKKQIFRQNLIENTIEEDKNYSTENGCLNVFLNNKSYRFPPKKGFSIIMNGDTLHSVNPFYSDQIRYSFQWNIEFFKIPSEIDIKKLTNLKK